MDDKWQYNILYSCVGEPKRGHDPFVGEHSLTMMLSGKIDIFTDKGVLGFQACTLGLIKRNQLLKVVKKPDGEKPFMSVSIFLNQELLKQYSLEHGIKSSSLYTGEPNIVLPVDSFMKGYFDSLLPYFEHPKQLTETLAKVKTIEAIELLLRNPSLKNLLFDFSDPFKIDLEAYMNRHYTYNVPLVQFARLTGRSLATFKRDFAKIFSTAPERWLRQKRLEHAHFLLAKKLESPGEAYLNAGFENLSHFSTAFKKHFGYTPSSVNRV